MLGKFFPKKAILDIKVVFHKDANDYVEHGTIYADHVQFRLENYPVRFAFTDMEPPTMTPEILKHVFDEAEKAGYKVHSLRSYATVVTVQPSPRLAQGSKSNADGRPPRQGISRNIRRPSGERAEGHLSHAG